MRLFLLTVALAAGQLTFAIMLPPSEAQQVVIDPCDSESSPRTANATSAGDAHIGTLPVMNASELPDADFGCGIEGSHVTFSPDQVVAAMNQGAKIWAGARNSRCINGLIIPPTWGYPHTFDGYNHGEYRDFGRCSYDNPEEPQSWPPWDKFPMLASGEVWCADGVTWEMPLEYRVVYLIYVDPKTKLPTGLYYCGVAFHRPGDGKNARNLEICHPE